MRLTRGPVAAAVVWLAGCGLVLDAHPRDAGPDTSSMDAPGATEDAVVLPEDAVTSPEDAVVVTADAVDLSGDASGSTDVGLHTTDATPTMVDAASLDAWGAPDDAFVPADATSDASREDAWSCITGLGCGLPTLAGTAPIRTCGGLGCSAGTCGPRINVECPVSGCTTGCEWFGSSLRCVRSNTRCAEPLHACDTDDMCLDGFTCRELPCGLPGRVCVPVCSSFGSCSLTVSGGIVLTGTCTAGACLPSMATATPWCDAISRLGG